MTGIGDHRRGRLMVNAIAELAEMDEAVTETRRGAPETTQALRLIGLRP